MKFFSLDSPIIRFLSWITDMILLNIVWIVYSLPVITLGASTAALYTVVYKMSSDPYVSIWKTFHKAFVENFKKATPLFFLLLATCASLVFLEFQWLPVAGKTSVALYILALLPMVIFLMSASMVFPLVARFDNTLFGTLRNAFLIAMSHIPTALVMAVVHLIPVIMLFISPMVLLGGGIALIFAGASLTACFNSYLAGRLLRPFMPKEDDNSDNEVTEDGKHHDAS